MPTPDLLRERDQLKAELAQARAHNAALIEACDKAGRVLAGLACAEKPPVWVVSDEVYELMDQLRAAIALEKGEK